MKIAVLSGKGGAGKTFTAVNLISAAGRGTYIDCDVEEPNGRIFLKPDEISEETVSVRIPVFDREKCTGCRKCVDFCRFNALIYIKNTPVVFNEICHSCGGCGLVCPEKAVSYEERPVGKLETGKHGSIKVVTGILNLGEASGVPVIKKALSRGEEGLTVIDCPPGSACSAMASIEDADYCIIVAEPTSFGFDNFRMVYELAGILGKPCGVVINKMEEPYEPLEKFCREKKLSVLARIPYSLKSAAAIADGSIVSDKDEHMAAIFRDILQKAGGVTE